MCFFSPPTPPPPQVAGVQRPGLPGHGGRAGGGDVPVSRVLGFSVAVRWVSPAAENGVRCFFFFLLVVVPCSLRDFHVLFLKVQFQIHLNFTLLQCPDFRPDPNMTLIIIISLNSFLHPFVVFAQI